MSIKHKSTSESATLAPASPASASADAIPPHPIADLFPALAEKELAELAEDIAANGQREPGVVWNGMLLEGKNRQLACIQENIPFKAVTREFADENEALAFSISANLRRRHLGESQRAMVGAKLVEFLSAAKQQASVVGDGVSNAGVKQECLKTRDKAAETLNVSGRSIQDAIKIRTKGAPELISAVNAGQVSVSAAAQVASLGKDEQANAVKTPGGVKAAAKKLRDLKKGSRRSRERKLPVNNLPSSTGASSSGKTVITPNDAEIDRAVAVFHNANAAYPECNGLAFRLLEGKHPGEAAEAWRIVEEFASKMRQAYERLDEKLNERMDKKKSSND